MLPLDSFLNTSFANAVFCLNNVFKCPLLNSTEMPKPLDAYVAVFCILIWYQLCGAETNENQTHATPLTIINDQRTTSFLSQVRHVVGTSLLHFLLF